jgi:16S rRNA (cytidine1402-2'-O)-methyltransferase
MGTLFVVATPIGNMEDLSPRARRVLADVSLIAAEDTRHTGIMLKRLGIETPMMSNHGFNERARVRHFLEALGKGDVALVSDSGTPAISDPGAILVRAAAESGYRVVPVPGPSALTSAVSASGLVEGAFTFLGFLPRSSGERAATLDSAMSSGLPLVLYESAPRIIRLGKDLAEAVPDRELVIFRELTKVHEEAIRGRASEVPALLAGVTLKGEFVIVVGPGAEQQAVDLDRLISERLVLGGRPSDIARELARQTGTSRSDVYARVLELTTRSK